MARITISESLLPNHVLREPLTAVGGRLAAWLNDRHDDSPSERLALIMPVIDALFRHCRELPSEPPYSFEPSQEWKCRYLLLCREVSEILYSFPFRYSVGGAHAAEFGAYLSLSIRLLPEIIPAKCAYVFQRAFSDILHLNSAGALGRIRKCHRCGRWFYAAKNHAKFCSPACQESHYRKNSDFKAHRKQYMRDYRELQKSGKVK